MGEKKKAFMHSASHLNVRKKKTQSQSSRLAVNNLKHQESVSKRAVGKNTKYTSVRRAKSRKSLAKAQSSSTPSDRMHLSTSKKKGKQNDATREVWKPPQKILSTS